MTVDDAPRQATPPQDARQRPDAPGWSVGFARNLWRRLTSMRTALILLFLLALASLPGALLPQWSLNSAKTAQYILDHPTLGPLLDRLGFFGVFASPWYAAIYLLLFVSLIGCVLPRTGTFISQLRARPVAAPRNLDRLPHHHTEVVPGSVAQTAERIRTGLRGWRSAERTEPLAAASSATPGSAGQARVSVTISAEKGYLREIGNLVFHLSLVGLLLSVAVGKLVGYEGSVIITTGGQFCSTSPASYDNFRPGVLVDGTDMAPFCVDVQDFRATYTDAGQALDFMAPVRYQTGEDAGTDSWDTATLRVNDPLRLDGERVYLLGHGFTPAFRITFSDGTVRNYEQPFAPVATDPFFTSEGAIKVTDPPGVPAAELTRHQLAIVGIFAPTAVVHGGIMTSGHPSPDNPGVAIDVYRGDLGMEGGRAQSVFGIDTAQVDKGALVRQARTNLMAGESVTLDDGTVITFTGTKEWVSLQTSYDPAQVWALLSAALLLGGLTLSLVVKRRRVWYRITPAHGEPPAVGTNRVTDPSVPDRTVVRVGGLARTDQAGYGEEFDQLAALPRADR